MPKSRRSAGGGDARASRRSAPGVSRAMACVSGSWTVTGTTRSSGQASSITGGTPVPAISPRYSVWPGCGEAGGVERGFLDRVGHHARRRGRPWPAPPPRRSRRSRRGHWPGRAGPAPARRGSGRCSTGSASAKTAAGLLRRLDPPDRRAGEPVASSIRKKAGPRRAAACQAPTAISPPMPAGSPMVTASGAELMLGM